jgi:hypothetical protein
MNSIMFVVAPLLTALVAGVLGLIAMEVVFWLTGRLGWAKADMILALGSLITKSRDNGFRVGLIVHVGSAVIFALLYTLGLMAIGYTRLPNSMMVGLGVGVLHGLMVSLMLVWVIADQHPLEEFKEADLAIGLSHVVAHAAFGAMVGLVVGAAHL